MNVAIEELSPCQKKLTIQLSAAEVNKEYQTVIRDLRQNIAIPGFRKGKASISTIKRRFSREIKNEVKEHLLEHSLKDALVDNEIAPVGSPSLDVKNITITENQPVEYDVEVEFIPAFELTDYKGVEIPKPSAGDVPEESITQALEMLQRQQAVNEPIADDEYIICGNESVTINYERFLDGDPLGEPTQDHTLWLGVDSVIPQLQEHLMGKKKGDHGTFSVQHGEESPNKELAGKSVEFIVDIVNVEKVTLPELDDEFAKDLEYESLDEVKEKIEEDIKARQERDAIQSAKNQILMKISETYDFEIPPTLIKEQKKNRPNSDEEDLKKMLRAGILLSKIQAQEDIQADDTELNMRIQQLAGQTQVPVAAMRNYLEQQGGLSRIRDDILEAKTLDFLYEHANLVEEK